MVIAAGAAALVLAGGTVGAVALLSNRDTGQQQAGGSPSTGQQAAGGSGSAAPTTTTTSAAPQTPPDEQCTDELKSNPRWVCLTSAAIADGKITIKYDTEFGTSPPNVSGGFHLHIFGSTGSNPPDNTMGTQFPANQRGHWYVEDRAQSVLSITDKRYTESVGPNATKVCARIATSSHQLVPDKNGTFRTGNCVPITR